MAKIPELFLVDGSSYIYRAYHVMSTLSNSKGCPTGAVFGFTNMIIKTLKDKSPERIAVIFDAKGPTFRHERYDQYKANRPMMPEDHQLQIPYIHRIADGYGLPVITAPGFEADDVIATLSIEARNKGWQVIIISGDKDLTQLVGEGVLMWDPQRDVTYDAEGVQKKYGAPPERIADLFGLIGDTSDNVPGIPGIGPKTASTLIEKYSCIEGVYENIEHITQKKVRENLLTHRDKAFLSRELVTLNYQVPLEVCCEDLVIGTKKIEELRDIFTELEFKKLLDELPAVKTLDFQHYCTVVTPETLSEWIDKMKRLRRFAVDVETTSEHPMSADLVGISFCGEDEQACYIPVGHSCGDQLTKSDVLDAVREILESPQFSKLGQNIKYDMIVLKREGVQIRGIECDTMLASYLLDANIRGHSLDDLAERCLQHRTIRIKELIGAGKKQITFSELEIANAYEYACEDAEVTFRVANVLEPRLKDEGLMALFKELEIPLIPVLVDMETTGVKIDIPYLTNLSQEFGETLSNLEAEIHNIAGECFNINSPKQLSDILFTRLGLKSQKKTKTGQSTSLDVLEQLALEHELPRKILDYRSIFKLKSTYADALVSLVNPQTGRIHTSYNQAVAATGRLSSSDPNLQNIPIRSAEGRKIRRAFIPEEGYVFVAADYSQVELRVMAHLSGDERLREAFTNNEDIHSITAASVFDCALGLITPEMRRKAKEINFGIIYGMGPFKLANQIGVGLGMAKQYLQEYYRLYSGVKQYMDEVPERAKSVGYVTTILGRKRFLPDLRNPNKIAQQAARRVAINTTIQGSAADLMKLAMIKLHDALETSGLPTKMILQVHDELILEAQADVAEEAAKLLKEQMESVYPLSVPLEVETSIGKNWDEAH